ncbi:MAG: protein-ADP-ribose hydrolase [Coriobacteriales bacterium]|jgi:O-acetyl-ADP-ribose deacetylase (regulator of RNase III)
MNQDERRDYLIGYLLEERDISLPPSEMPQDAAGKRMLLRALFNTRMPAEAPEEFIAIQDAYLKQRAIEKSITDYQTLKSIEEGIYLWRGDITTLSCDAIVNAANSALLGCFQPNHSCIDNAIHTFSGVQLRLACKRYLDKHGIDEVAPGGAVLTPAFNLPARYVLHTVGPIVSGSPTPDDERTLASCYRSCLECARDAGVQSVAFCCISTGVFGFPAERAASIAVKTVRQFREENGTSPDVIFNVFKESDYEIYKRALG